MVEVSITEDWLSAVGFRWHQLDGQPAKHWLLWLGDAVRARDDSLTSTEDLEIELAPCGRDASEWFCWFHSDAGGRYHRFIHLRHLHAQAEVIQIVEALTGLPWRPGDHRLGTCLAPRSAALARQEDERLDRRLLRSSPRWSQIERDDTRGRALPEHLEAQAASEGQPKP